MSAPKPGSPAPAFDLADQNGKRHRLADYQGKTVLLYFYPKDDTPGCTTEACGLRDLFGELQQAGCAVLGVSADDEKSHAKFAKKFDLPFPLLADTEKAVITAYGVWREKTFMGKKYMGIVRTSFLIDGDGVIAKIYEAVKPEEHADEVLSDAKDMK